MDPPAPHILASVVPTGNTNFNYVTGVYKESKYLERLLLTHSDFFGIFGASLGPNRDRVEILNRGRACCLPPPVTAAEPKENPQEAPSFPAKGWFKTRRS